MLAQIITENGQKKIVPLTADAGAGNPVGTVIVVCSNQIPSNYLPLGTQYDTSLYPVLYALLGTDTTPTASALGLPTLSSGQYAIKATSGLSENAQDDVLAQLNEERSYSTSEINTGKKWIDGKPIYKITKQGSETFSTTSYKNIAFFSDGVQKELVDVEGLISGIAYRVNYTTSFTNSVGFAMAANGAFPDSQTARYSLTIYYTRSTD